MKKLGQDKGMNTPFPALGQDSKNKKLVPTLVFGVCRLSVVYRESLAVTA